MKQRIKALWNDRQGASQLVSTVVCTIVLLAILVVALEGMAFANKYIQLDHFAGELSQAAAQLGRCSGNELNEKREQLVDATGLNPEVSYSAVYFNNTEKTVQYGDSIKVTVRLDTKIFGQDVTLTRAKNVQSEQYWK